MTNMPERPSRRNGRGVSAVWRCVSRQRQRPALAAYGREPVETRPSRAQRWLEDRFQLPPHLARLNATLAGLPTGDDE
ncbi:MAG: hypothetical protein K5905_22175 [Roseibium sp.]|uniref:hypothetical protein n=1 Tax=Roseibium sp. TaxID=1936156 RepID=UPI002619839F|nr:hypothetical protein [Roseibium sp.]MCV0428173.1 hypothetical protein [Roseibium sp.]